MKSIMGIDPGLKGGIAVISKAGEIYEPMPIIGNILDYPKLLSILQTFEVDHAFLELSHMRPGQSTQSVFTFARQIGAIEMALTALRIPYQTVPPQVWTKVVHAGLPGNLDPKEKSRLALSRLFPKVDARIGRAKNVHEGIMDALLIAWFGRNTLTSVVN